MGSCGWLRRSASGFNYPNGTSALAVSQFINDPDLGVPDHLARRGREVPAQRARPVHQAHLAHRVCLGRQVRLGLQVRPARRGHAGQPARGRQDRVPRARDGGAQRGIGHVRWIPSS
jgi:hypothetical protein